MRNYSKYFLSFLAIAILVVTIARFEQYRVEKNFLLVGTIECSPESESCFVTDCAPESDPECDQTTYKKIEISAKSAPDCLYEHNCEDFTCLESNGCRLIQCSEESLEEGEGCSKSVENL